MVMVAIDYFPRMKCELCMDIRNAQNSVNGGWLRNTQSFEWPDFLDRIFGSGMNVQCWQRWFILHDIISDWIEITIPSFQQ